MKTPVVTGLMRKRTDSDHDLFSRRNRGDFIWKTEFYLEDWLIHRITRKSAEEEKHENVAPDNLSSLRLESVRRWRRLAQLARPAQRRPVCGNGPP